MEIIPWVILVAFGVCSCVTIHRYFKHGIFGKSQSGIDFNMRSINSVWSAWDEIYIDGEVEFKRNSHGYPRYTVTLSSGPFRGTYFRSRVVWHCMHPGDSVGKDEEIHHDDYDSTNDCPINLIKLHHDNHVEVHKKWTAPTGLRRTHQKRFNNGLQGQLQALMLQRTQDTIDEEVSRKKKRSKR